VSGETTPGAAAPTVDEVRRIARIANPVLRNLEITHCYARLAAAFAARGRGQSPGLSPSAEGANWCTYATWASKQAGSTIRGEDLVDEVARRLVRERWLLHPFRTLWRRLLRRGLFERDTRLGRLTAELNTPFDAVERASDAVARGNLKVFEEIGLEFARYLHECPADDPAGSDACRRFLEGLRPGEPPDGQLYLRRAFVRYMQARHEPDARLRTELTVLANLEIGFHEQTRLQPEILAALDAASATKTDLGHRALVAAFPTAARLWPAVRRPAAALFGVVAARVQRAAARVAREVITDSFMVLAVPDRVLALGTHLADPYPDALRDPRHEELLELLGRFEPAPPADDDCGARDWSDLQQRMHYIVHLFCAFHLSESLARPPFTPAQVASVGRGVVPDGAL
jgi:hypothetical protein